MNLEQIDTSTTAGKAEVMRLAVEGRRIAIDYRDGRGWQVWGAENEIEWNWGSQSFAIIAEPVGPEEVWVQLRNGALWAYPEERDGSVRYIRADLAGEKG